jgi:folate-binding protein YgfZ
MRHDTPLRNRHEAWVRARAARAPDPAVAAQRGGAATGRPAATDEAMMEYVAYGPPGADGAVECEVPATFGEPESEYAAIRRSAGIVDAPHRGTLRVTGEGRRAFLGNMLTQDLRGLDAGGVRASFWLNRKGRIEADLLLVESESETLIDVDVHQAARAAASLGAFLFAEDVSIADESAARHRLAVHGPAAARVVAAAAGDDAIALLAPMRAVRGTIGSAPVVVARRDQTGGIGLEIFLDRATAEAVWDGLLAAGERVEPGRVRPVGWYAYNTARIEAGTPLFNVDFAAENVPHETGVLADRVSFTKGCYLGQEIVARIEHLGRPKQLLLGLRMREDRLPVSGAQVFAAGAATLSEPIGAVTSSTISPMLGAVPIAFAQMRTAEAELGATVVVSAEGGLVPAEVVALGAFQPARSS